MDCRYLAGDDRSLGTSKPTCIKVKFTSIPRRLFWKMGRWLTEDAAPGVPLARRPLHPFIYHLGKEDRPESFNPKAASEPLRPLVS
jgi:hypothetical protein